MESGLKSNIHMMWLSGMSYPDHNTLNRFRGDRLSASLEEVFRQVVLLLIESGHVNLKSIYTDGTKIEGNANKYSFVWGKSIQTNKAKLYKQIEELWHYAQRVAQEEMSDKELVSFEAIDAQKMEQTIQTLNTALKEQIEHQSIDKTKVDKLHYAHKHYVKKLEEYAVKEALLAGRNSYSKTDPDATFMRLKDDHMQNGQLKAAYNCQVSTENQFVVHYSNHQCATDTTTYIDHMEGLRAQFGDVVEEQTADAGYGSEENYMYLEQHNIEGYVKFNQFHNEQKKGFKDKIAHIDNLYYNTQNDYFVCPMGQHMRHSYDSKTQTTTGFEQTISHYQAKNCDNCPLRGVCFSAKGNRTIHVNHNLRRLKDKARQLLNSEKGIQQRKKRCCDVEPVFGNIKYNHFFNRFHLRSLKKVNIEIGLICLAHNLRKKTAA